MIGQDHQGQFKIQSFCGITTLEEGDLKWHDTQFSLTYESLYVLPVRIKNFTKNQVMALQKN